MGKLLFLTKEGMDLRGEIKLTNAALAHTEPAPKSGYDWWSSQYFITRVKRWEACDPSLYTDSYFQSELFVEKKNGFQTEKSKEIKDFL